jgi:choline-sulfatase
MKRKRPDGSGTKITKPRRHKGSFVIFVIVVAFVLSAWAVRRWWPSSYSPADGPIIIISIDTLRADRLPAYGYGKVRTPNIDALAAAGTVFERAYSHVPQTLPAHASILSGALPFEHGVRDNVGFTVKPGQWFVQRALKERGWDTGGFVSAYVMRAAVGLNQGFDTYDSDLPPASGERSIGQVQRSGEATLSAAEKWLNARDRQKPFFLLLHVYEPHKPYTPPPRFATYEPYDGEIAYTDEIVGRLFDRLRTLDLYDRSTIILLADHGEGLGDHGEQEHGLFLYNATTQVPLIVKLPGQDRARRVASPVQHIDIVPTILDLAGAPPRPGLLGRSLRKLLDGTGTISDTGIYSEALYSRYHFGWSELYGLTDARYRLIRAPRDELYDVERDPKESTSIAAERPRGARLRGRRQQHVAVPAGRLARRSEGQGLRPREIPPRHGTGRRAALRRGDDALP